MSFGLELFQSQEMRLESHGSDLVLEGRRCSRPEEINETNYGFERLC